MATYALGLVRIKDKDLEGKMISGMMALYGRHEMELIAAPSTKVEVVEGSWEYDSFVLVKFPDRARAEAFLNDPDFKALEEMRQQAGDASFVLFDDIGP